MSMTDYEVEKELDRIYDLEDLALEGRIETWNTVLSLVDHENIDVVFLLAYVVTTRPYADRLTNRVPIVESFTKRCPEEYKKMAWFEED